MKVLENKNINELLLNLGLGIHKINHLLNTNKVKAGKRLLKPNDLVNKDDIILIDISEYEKIGAKGVYFIGYLCFFRTSAYRNVGTEIGFILSYHCRNCIVAHNVNPHILAFA